MLATTFTIEKKIPSHCLREENIGLSALTLCDHLIIFVETISLLYNSCENLFH